MSSTNTTVPMLDDPVQVTTNDIDVVQKSLAIPVKYKVSSTEDAIYVDGVPVYIL